MQKFIFILGCLIMTGCSVIKPTPKRAFVDGIYLQKKDKQVRKVYVDVEDDILRVHPTQSAGGQLIVDTSSVGDFYPEQIKEKLIENTFFSRQSFDVDFLTIPLKYRFASFDVPPQLNTTLNGTIYLGYRVDKYVVDYKPDFLSHSLRNITHYGFSFGLFNGLGSTAMTPTNTFNNISQEYNGVVWNKGLAEILTVNNFVVGLSFGIDNLLDTNKKVWIYESKPCVGIAVGLNLN